MRRGLLVGLVLVGVAAGVVLLTAGKSSDYRVDAIFDTAQGMVAGQDVKIAGTKVGTVHAVRLTADLKARMELQIDPRFVPFHRDATCRILPEGLISENYVECDPGDAPAALGRGPAGVPTVPLAHTVEPVTLQQLLNIFTVPTSDRLRLMLNELGIATAGEGQDINAILLRANPVLGQARRVLGIIDVQRRQVATAVGQADQVIRQLAVRDRQVSSFVDNAAAVARTSAAHRSPLGESVGRLPALLASVRGAFGALNRFSASAPPLLADLRASAPSLTTLTSTLPAFTSAASPAIRSLGLAGAQGTLTARSAEPAIAHLTTFTSHAGPTAKPLDQLLVSMRDRGAIEGLLNFLYSLATAGSTYDSLSHIATIDAVVPPCIADQGAPGCDANFHRPAAAADTNTVPPHGSAARRGRSAPSGAVAPPAPAAPAAAAPPTQTQPAAAPGSTAQATSALSGLIQYLLK